MPWPRGARLPVAAAVPAATQFAEPFRPPRPSAAAGRLSGICHSVGQGWTNWFAFAEAFLERMGVPHRLTPCGTDEYPTPAHRPANSILDDRRLREAGLLVMDDWRAALNAFVDRHRDELLAEARASLG